MATLPSNSLKFFWWLRKLMSFWVKTKVVPAQPRAELGLKPGVPVCYVLNAHSLPDLLALDAVCRAHGLPLPYNQPEALRFAGAASYIYMQRVGLVQVERKSKKPPSPLLKLLHQAQFDPQMEVQLVPVSVFWGRNPGKEEKSLLKLLFFDEEHAGSLQKFFIVLAQGGANFMHFGKPISLRGVADEGLAAPEAAKKLRRVLRVHFRRQRTAATGPSLPSRASVMASLLQSRVVREAVAEEARKKKVSHERAEEQARRYIVEIISNQAYPMIRLSDKVLRWVWNRIFAGLDIRHAQRLRDIPQTHEIVYLPSHRSHLDYLLLAYSIYHEGLTPPHTAAGINLNFWPVGPLLRRGGAFYLRRTFGGNRLYATIFTEYVHYLLTKGHPLKFYIEGGRSRTGRLLQPKTGMLSMVLQSYVRSSERPIVIVPIYLGYDKVMEVRTYQTELRGKAKRKESVGQLVKARSALKSNFGRAYIGFGSPIYLEGFLNERHPGWRSEVQDAEAKPKWMHKVVEELAENVLTRVNSTAVLSPMALFALVILSTPTRAMAEDDLIYLMGKLVNGLRAVPYSRDLGLPDGTPAALLREAIGLAKAERFQHPSGDVIYLDEKDAVLLTYYRNNVLHLVAVPSLVASFFQHNEEMGEEDLIHGCMQLYPFLRADYFLRWDERNTRRVVEKVTQALVDDGLLFRGPAGMLRRPDVTSRDLTSLFVLGRTLGQTFERYAISTALLAKSGAAGPIDRKEFEAQCQLMAQRISILYGSHDPEFFDKNLFRNYIDQFQRQGYASEGADGRLTVAERTLDVAASAMNLLSADIRQSIQRLSLEGAVRLGQDKETPPAAAPAEATVRG